LIGYPGDRNYIDGFNVYVNGIPAGNAGSNSYTHSVRYFEPPCGARYEFQMTAYKGRGESPLSNSVYWSGEECPKRYRVSFERFITGGWNGQD